MTGWVRARAFPQVPADAVIAAARVVVLAACAALLGWSAYLGRPDELATAALGLPGMSDAALSWAAFVGLVGLCALVRESSAREWVAVFFGWSLGAASVIPAIWSGYFDAPAWQGWIVLLAWAASMSAWVFLLPRAALPLALPIWLVVSALVPPFSLVGFGSALLAGSAGFPGLGAFAFVMPVLVTLSLYASNQGRSTRARRLPWLFFVGTALTGSLGANMSAHQPPAWSWALSTSDGAAPPTLATHFDRQDRLMRAVSAALDEGARLVVLPESSNRSWGDGQAAYWSSVTEKARSLGATVLLGVTTDQAIGDEPINALADLGGSSLHHTMMPMPIGMWRPWDVGSSIPVRLAVEPVRMAQGEAIYSICYEDLLVWPVLSRWFAASKPVVLVSAANQWFAPEWAQVPQSRSVRLMARALGLPLVRAVAQGE